MYMDESDSNDDVSFSGDEDTATSTHPPNHARKEWWIDGDDIYDDDDRSGDSDSGDGAADPPPARKAQRRSRRSDDGDFELQSEWDIGDLENADDGGAAERTTAGRRASPSPRRRWATRPCRGTAARTRARPRRAP